MNLIQALLILITISLNIISPRGTAINKLQEVLGESTSKPNSSRPTPKEFHRTSNSTVTEIKRERVQKIASPSPTLSQTQKTRIQEKEEETHRLKVENAKTIVIKQKLLEKELNASAGSGLKESEKQKIKEEREQYKAKIELIHDEKKKQAVINIESKIAQISKKMIDKMNEVVGKLNTLLTTLNSQITLLKSQGVNTSNAEIASVEAQTAIINAQTAVIDQLEKTYTPEIPTDDSKLKESVGASVSMLSKDLGITHKAVSDAKEAVTKVYKEMSLLKSELNSTSSLTK